MDIAAARNNLTNKTTGIACKEHVTTLALNGFGSGNEPVLAAEARADDGYAILATGRLKVTEKSILAAPSGPPDYASLAPESITFRILPFNTNHSIEMKLSIEVMLADGTPKQCWLDLHDPIGQ